MSDRAFSILCFYSGTTRLGLAAGAVVSVKQPLSTAPHICQLLSTERNVEVTGRRTLRIGDDGHLAAVTVDGPVHIYRFAREQLLPLPPGLPHSARANLIGLAQDERGLCVVLSAPVLVSQVESWIQSSRAG